MQFRIRPIGRFKYRRVERHCASPHDRTEIFPSDDNLRPGGTRSRRMAVNNRIENQFLNHMSICFRNVNIPVGIDRNTIRVKNGHN